MRIFQGLIEFAIFVILLGVALWWSWFCFTKGYTLGKNGTDNQFADWTIEMLLGAEKNSNAKESAPRSNLMPLQWFQDFPEMDDSQERTLF